MSILSSFKSLPKSSKRLLSLGIILGLVVALPLFIWSIINMTFDVRENAQTPSTTIDIVGEPIVGLSTAPVTIVAYSDFLCPFCKAFVDDTFSTILANYPNEVKFVFKDFPITTEHPLAENTAIAGQCAFAQNKFWEMHDLIFANQDTLVESDFSQFATQLSLDTTAFSSCYTNQTPLSEVNADFTEGQALGVSGTPTFFINGTKLEGAHPYLDFKTLIDAALLDDVFFKTTGNSVTFVTTDQTPNVSVNPEDLVDGNTYVVQVNYSLQNNVKYPEASTSGVPVTLLVNNVFKSSKDIPYSLIAVHADGASDSQTTSFTAQGGITDIKVVFDPNNILTESNNDNNTLNFSFSNTTTTSSPTATTTSTTTSSPTATAIATATPTSEPVDGEPNSCGGTCGSNYNCKANLYCYKGYCRNPICSEKTDCSCTDATAKPTSTAKAQSGTKGQVVALGTSKGSPKPTPTYVSGITRLTDDGANLEREKDNETAPQNMFWSKYAIYIFGLFVVIVIVSISLAVKKNKNSDIPHIMPPTNI